MSFIVKGIKNLFSGPKTPEAPDPPPPPPSTPTRANASFMTAGNRDNIGLQSLITTSGQGLARKSNTQKRSLIGGA